MISFWSITYGALKFRRCFFDDFSTFVRISLILAGSDPKFNTVLMRSPNVFGIFTLQISRVFAEIYDFEQFSWAPVQDFSKSTLLLERYLCIFSLHISLQKLHVLIGFAVKFTHFGRGA